LGPLNARAGKPPGLRAGACSAAKVRGVVALLCRT